jgi:hypothetical protein
MSLALWKVSKPENAAKVEKGPNPMWARLAAIVAVSVILASCEDKGAPAGRWEGFGESQSWMIAVRLEMRPNNVMRASALSAMVAGWDLPSRHGMEKQLRQGMRDQWYAVTASEVSFRANTLTRKEGYAPLFVYEPRTGSMVFHFYAGGKLTEKVTLRPVETFAR